MTTVMPHVVNEEYNEQGLLTRIEWSDGKWKKWEYNAQGLCTYWEDSYGFSERLKYNKVGETLCLTSIESHKP